MLARTRVDDDDVDDDDDGDSLVMVKSLLSRNDAHVATCRREVELFSRVSHDHVTRLVALCCKMEPLYLVTEYCEWVRFVLTLATHMGSCRSQWKIVLELFTLVVYAYIHSVVDVIHQI